jgi:hypothetical protein
VGCALLLSFVVVLLGAKTSVVGVVVSFDLAQSLQ